MVVFLFVLVLAAADTCAAQTSTSSVTGTVLDKDGRGVPGAKLVIKNEGTGVEYPTTTTSTGDYAVNSLVPGLYTVTVTKDGFRTFVSTHNVLTVGAPVVVDAKLQLGSVTEVVQVEGSYERLNTTNAMVSDVVSRREINDLPLNGGNPLTLITLQPGLVQRSTGNRGSGTHVNGSRDRAFNVTLDGIDINEPSVPNPQSNVFRVNTNNIQEYRIVTQSPTAEYGRNSGANIALATRSGTNDFHGDAYEVFRNTVLNAKDWFTNAQNQPKPVFHLNQFGVDVGGPIVRKKLFFFFSWEQSRLNFTQPIATAFGGTPVVYTDEVRKGIFRYVVGTVNGKTRNDRALVDSGGKLLPGIPSCSGAVTTNCIATYDIFANDPLHIGLDSVMGPFIKAEPPPNDFGATGDGLNTAGFSWNPPASYPEQRWLFRLDHQINDNNSIFGRFTFTNGESKVGDLLNNRPIVFPGFPPTGNVKRKPRNLALSYRHVFSPRWVNELTAGYSRFQFDFAFGRANPAFSPTDPTTIPPFSPANISSPYINQSGTSRWLTTLQLIDNMSYTVGSHSFRVGANIRMIRHNDQRSFVGGVNNAPTVAFSGSRRVQVSSSFNPFNVPLTSGSLAINSSDQTTLRNAISDTLGLPGSIAQAYFAGGPSAYTPSGLYIRGARLHQYDFYAQDEWKLRRNLTLNLGARYEWNPPATEANNLILRPDKPIDFSQGLVNYVQKTTFWDRQNRMALLPRVGLAWDPFSNGKMAIRAGYSMAYDTVSTFQLVPILGLVPGSSAQCSFTLTDSSSGLSKTPSATFCSSTADSTKLALRIGQGFPKLLTPPSALPSSFASTTALVAQNSGSAPVAGAIDSNLQNPTVHEWTLNIQRDLGKNIILQVGYIGKRGTHLFRAYNLNQVKINHDDYIGSFIRARDNLNNCGSATAAAPCGQPVGLLQSILGASNLSNSSVTNRLKANAAGSLAAFIDSDGIAGIFDSMAAFTNRKDFFRPNPQFSSIFYFESGGDSFYHALQVYLRRQERNFSFGLAYTFGKSLDNMSTDPVGATSSGNIGNATGNPTDIYNFNVDRGHSDFDRTHVLTGNFVWDLPFGRGQRWSHNVSRIGNIVVGGWSVTGIVTAMSGERFSVTSGEFTNSNVRVSRTDIVGAIPATGLFFNVPGIGSPGPTVFPINVLPQTNPTGTPFRIPAPGSNGNQARNIFKGPRVSNIDFGVSKQFTLTERINLQFRADFFNVFNHPNFDNPPGSTNGSTSAYLSNSTSSNSSFGLTCCAQLTVPSQANVVPVGDAPRVIQFALKFIF
jgi:hypothetical protein